MERRKALALAATITAVLGSAAVAVAAVGGTSLLGFGGTRHAAQVSGFGPSGRSTSAGTGVITRTKDVYDLVTVGGSIGAAGPRSAGLVSVTTSCGPDPSRAGDATGRDFASWGRGASPASSEPRAFEVAVLASVAPTTSTTATTTTEPVRPPAPTTTTTTFR